MSTQGTSLDPAAEGLSLPSGIELLEVLGTGKFSRAYKATYLGETVALKAYSEQAVNYYRKKLDKNIAVYEMAQNRAFRKVPELVPYTAKPVRVIGQDGSSSLCYLQEFIAGVSVPELVKQLGQLPGSVISAGEMIDRTCDEKGLEGLDQFMADVLVHEHAGLWMPVIYDFKHIPQPRSSSNSLLSRLGLGRKGGPRGFLKDWHELAKQATKNA